MISFKITKTSADFIDETSIFFSLADYTAHAGWTVLSTDMHEHGSFVRIKNIITSSNVTRAAVIVTADECSSAPLSGTWWRVK